MLVLLGLGVHYCRLRLLVSLLVLLLLTIPSTATAEPNNEVEWLAMNLYHEARGESTEGQTAVAIATINRIESNWFPSTMEGVITQPGQYSWYWDGKSDKPKKSEVYENCHHLASVLIGMWRNNHDKYREMVGQKGLEGVYWYHNTKVIPYWAYEYKYVHLVDNHKFYRRI